MELIGVYKTKEAAAKAKKLMTDRGIPTRRTSILSPDDTRGPHLATYPYHQAFRFALLGGLVASGIGALFFALLGSGTLTLMGSTWAGWWLAAGVGMALALPVGLIGGAVAGLRRPMLRADFFKADEKKGGTALGVIAESEEERESAHYAFRATGALRVRGRGTPDTEAVAG
ncbi:MAG: hypothetical protein AAGA56_18555 [Myxococcota bacterium]